MRTLIGAAEPSPPPREPAGRISFTANTGTASTTSILWWASPPTETQPREPYRTTAHVGEPVREIESFNDDDEQLRPVRWCPIDESLEDW